MAHIKIFIDGGANLNIAYASDNNFVDVMCVSIMSFNDHNYDATIYILDCGIEEHNKQKILELCSGKNTVLFVDTKKVFDKLPDNLNLDRGSIAAYARLFIGSMLPQNIEKILYLDSDTLIRESLKELFGISLESFVIGGVRDSFSVFNKEVFGIKKGGLMINSGVLLIDLTKWRKQRIEEKIYQLIDKKKKVFQGDQGIINTIFHGEVKELPLKYDVMTYLYDFSYEEMICYRKPDNYFSKEDIKKNIENPAIVHFSSSFKSYRPWENATCTHPYFDEWNKLFSKSGGNRTNNNKRLICTNSKMVFGLIGILHAYLRPLRQKIIC